METKTKENNVYVTTTYEVKSKNGVTKTIKQRKVENGFIISIEKYTPSSKGIDSKWETKEYISTDSKLESSLLEEGEEVKGLLDDLGYKD